MPSDETILKEARENFDYYVDSWRSIREEAAKDMRFIAGDPWDPAERRAREAAKRPCVALDELNQYCNQLINDVRQNKRAIKIAPKSDGATDETAEFRENLIRDIQAKSKAQSVFSWGFQDAVQRSYGFARVSKRYLPPPSFDQELVIKRIPNPDTVWIDPDCKESDFSDMSGAFIAESMRNSKFRKLFPKARVTDFSPEMSSEFPRWIKGDGSVQVAEYWRKTGRNRELLLLDIGAGSPGLNIYLDELGRGAEVHDSQAFIRGGVELDDGLVVPAGKYKLLKSRTVSDEQVTQYLTNGVEILEQADWDGKYIPLVVFIGKEMYVDFGDGPKRIILSLIRLARDPYLLYCYVRTTQLELAGMVPKSPAIGYEGQFEGHEEEWQNVNKSPIPYLQVKALTDATGGQVLPKPEWQRWAPPLQEYELLAESAKRAIQASMGMYNASVGRQDASARSGVAIKTLDSQASQGSYHFIDNYDRALEHCGRILDDLLDKTYDTARDVGIRRADEKHQVVRINEPHIDPKTNKEEHFRTDIGQHDVTITTGPSYESQREEATDFANLLAQNEAIFPRIADLVVKLRNLGPIGDEIAKRLTPPDIAAEQNGQQQLPPQVQQQMQQMQQELQGAHAYAQSLLQQLTTKQAELDNKKDITEMQEQTKRIIALAQLQAKDGMAILEADIARLDSEVNRRHDLAMQGLQQQHEGAQGARDRQAEMVQQAAAQQHEQALAQQQSQMALEQQQAAAQQQPQEGSV